MQSTQNTKEVIFSLLIIPYTKIPYHKNCFLYNGVRIDGVPEVSPFQGVGIDRVPLYTEVYRELTLVLTRVISLKM